MSLAYVGYKNLTGNGLVKTGPTKFYGLVAPGIATVTIYDGTTAGGTAIYNKVLAAGDVVHFGGPGMALNSGLYVATTAAVNILYQ
jgi:hypothetical protein